MAGDKLVQRWGLDQTDEIHKHSKISLGWGGMGGPFKKQQLYQVNTYTHICIYGMSSRFSCML